MTAAAGGKKPDVDPFPWDAAMHLGFCLLRLKPSDFWSLTPIELFAMAGGLKPRSGALDRFALEAMMRCFPDGDHTHGR